MRIIISLIIIAFSNLLITCKKRIDCKQTIYSFEGNYKAYPDLDSVHINDTIWLELNVPTNLKDFSSNQIINYSGAENFGPSIEYIELRGGDVLNTGAFPAANFFFNVLLLGTIIPSDKPDLIRGFKCKEEDGMYLFKLGIVPKNKGLFAISTSNAVNVYTQKNKCDKAEFNLTFKDTDQHLYLYEQSRPGYIISSYEKAHAYIFKVY